DQIRPAPQPTRDTGADIRVDHADRFERRTHFEADALPRIDRVNVTGHERQLTAAQAIERMAPAVHPATLDVGDGADAGKVEISLNQGNSQRAARLQRGILLLIG